MADKTAKKQTEQFGGKHTLGNWVSNFPEVYLTLKLKINYQNRSNAITHSMLITCRFNTRHRVLK